MYGTGLLHTNAEKYAPRYTGEFFQTHLESNADYKVLDIINLEKQLLKVL